MLENMANSDINIVSESTLTLETLIVKNGNNRLFCRFISNNFQNLFKWIQDIQEGSERASCLFKREVLRLVSLLVIAHDGEVLYPEVRSMFANSLTRIKCIFMNLSSNSESVNYRAAQLLSLYLEDFRQITNKSVQILLVRNRANLHQAVTAINFDVYDPS